MKKIDLIILSELDPNAGGRETWLYNFFPRVVERATDFEFTVIGFKLRNGNSRAEQLLSAVSHQSRNRLNVKQLNIPVSGLPFVIRMARAIRAYSRSKKFSVPDIVLGMGINELIMILLSRYRSAKKIVWLRGIYLHEKAYRIPRLLIPLLARLEIYFLRKVDFVLANGEDIASHYREKGINVHVIPNGVDLTRWKQEPSVRGEILRIAYIGRVSEVKGIKEYLRLVRAIKATAHGQNFEFHVVGDGDYVKTADFQSALNLIVYHGTVPNRDLPTLLRVFDVCVGLTLSGASGGGGGTSNALLEQLAAGKIILAWRTPHFTQILSEESAFLVEQGDIKGLEEALQRIYADEDLARRKAGSASRLATRFSIEAKVNECVGFLAHV